MASQPGLEQEIVDLLVRSRSIGASRDSAAVGQLIAELLDCARRAKAAGLVFSERLLNRAASDLRQAHPFANP